VSVQAEQLGVRSQKAARVRMTRQELELLVFQGPQVTGANLCLRLDISEIGPLACSCLAQLVTDRIHDLILADWLLSS
jgi:hypothetical protein